MLALALAGVVLGHTSQPPPVRISSVAAVPVTAPGAAGTAPSTGSTPEAGQAALPPSNTPAAPVAAPTRLVIPAIGVDAPVSSGGLNADGTVQVPPMDQPGQVDWYSGGPAPGALGPAVLLGHVNTQAGPAVFAKLPKLRPGDRVEIRRADGSTATFQVRELQDYPKDGFPSQTVYGNTANPQLRLITCGGTLRSDGHYSDNIVVFADLITS
ncbi:class F sortase [Kitasatospora sp. NBC_01287]|uniref:class F sortase n=1 Tax=Kitasatospora sp. NBC_01287 TaxID=2903573 RepID=UPI00225315D8|nr:class F sortase [Kitasatospora sp. NBC_01287]MCX4748542.1 class F sortase [Kitasatospora sp. NBC_01287]